MKVRTPSRQNDGSKQKVGGRSETSDARAMLEIVLSTDALTLMLLVADVVDTK